MDDTSFAKFILALDEHLQLFRRAVTLSRPKRSLIETIQRGGLHQERERLGSVGRVKGSVPEKRTIYGIPGLTLSGLLP
jgi:hypothetical protein